MSSVNEKIRDPDVVRGEIFVVYFLLFAICLLERQIFVSFGFIHSVCVWFY
jgi:hypothetical protein